MTATAPATTSRHSRLSLAMTLKALAAGAGLMPGLVLAASVPQGFTDTIVARNFERPSAMTALPDGRVLVLQATGVVRILKQDALLPTPFHVVANTDSSNERGCLGITADPAFATNGYVYLYCTVSDGAASSNRVIRVTAQGDVAADQTVLRQLPPVPEGVRWHMGGGLRFGPDGKLYVGVGSHEDLRPAPDVANSQDLSNPFGKVLRLNADGSVPADNPFSGTQGADASIYAYGLRNPYGINFSQQGRMFINDVGAGGWEEVNEGEAGANYGWTDVEGPSNDPAYKNPLYAYQHVNNACAITGTIFYNPAASRFPTQYRDAYFYVDFCDGQIRALLASDRSQPVQFASGLDSAVALTVAPNGSLYYLNSDYVQGGQGSVGRITYNDDQFLGGSGGNPFGSTGGGCTIGGNGKFDPLWPVLSLLALGMILRRRKPATRKE